jgi:hypothetical protein
MTSTSSGLENWESLKDSSLCFVPTLRRDTDAPAPLAPDAVAKISESFT